MVDKCNFEIVFVVRVLVFVVRVFVVSLRLRLILTPEHLWMVG